LNAVRTRDEDSNDLQAFAEGFVRGASPLIASDRQSGRKALRRDAPRPGQTPVMSSPHAEAAYLFRYDLTRDATA
jgi:hypothetical protein